MNTANGIHFDNTAEGLKAWHQNLSKPTINPHERLRPLKPDWHALAGVLGGQTARFMLGVDKHLRDISATESAYRENALIQLQIPAGWASVTIENSDDDAQLMEAHKVITAVAPGVYCERPVGAMFTFLFRLHDDTELEPGTSVLQNDTVLRLSTYGLFVPICGRPWVTAASKPTHPGALVIPRENRPGSVAPEAFLEWLDGLTWEVEQC